MVNVPNFLVNLDAGLLGLVRAVGDLAERKGMKAYLVGGPVRDLMLKRKRGLSPLGGHPSVDLDITVEGQGMRLAADFAALHPGAKVVRYPAFKTATVTLTDGQLVDFATSRKETYSRGGAFPKVVPSNIKDDLFRRDFTVNAMAISINPKTWGELVDPFGGKADLAAKRLRILHAQSFVDDPTRILRMARFKARLGFAVEAKTLKSLEAALQMKVLDTIRPQRYLKDFKKIEKEANMKEAVRFLQEWGALVDVTKR